MWDSAHVFEILKHHPWSEEAVADGACPVLVEMGIDPGTEQKF